MASELSPIEMYEGKRLQATLNNSPKILNDYEGKLQEEGEVINEIRESLIQEFSSESTYEYKHLGPNVTELKEIEDMFSEDRALIEFFLKEGYGDVLSLGSEKLRDDKELAFQAIMSAPRVLRSLSPRLQDDEQLVTKAMEIDPFAFEYASDRLHGNIDLVKMAVNKYAILVSCATDHLKEETSFWVAMIEVNKEVVEFIPEKKSCLAIELLSRKGSKKLLKNTPKYLVEKPSFWNKMIKIHGIKAVEEYIPRGFKHYGQILR